jgi:hypothetical protein
VGILRTASGAFDGETVAKHDVLLYWTFIMACSDLWAIHQWKYNNGKKEISLVA